MLSKANATINLHTEPYSHMHCQDFYGHSPTLHWFLTSLLKMKQVLKFIQACGRTVASEETRKAPFPRIKYFEPSA